ncbi:MAG TPA: tetratricopeptide repeat protein [Opitutaceae bacterium]|nr:tetratricopeptide repeat protein [Opitutaceae bacterium]
MDVVLGVLLLSAVFVSYRPAWHGGFLWDDEAHVTRAELQSWAGLGRIWSDPSATQQYYPILHSAFWVEHHAFGDNPTGYHLVSLALHALNALLLVVLLRRFRVPGAWLAAGVFALHPVMVESVAWISELKNTLSGAFYLGTALAYLRFDTERRRRWYVAAVTLFLLALGTKTVTATLPGALLVVFWWQRGALSSRRDVLPLMPFFVLGAAGGLFTAWVESNLIGAAGPDYSLSAPARVLLAGRVICFYAAKLLWPANLIFIYPRWHVTAQSAAQYFFPVILLAALAGLWWWRRRSRAPLAGALVFIGTLFPVLGFFDIFPFQFSYVADHFQYLASLGVIVPLAAALAIAGQRLPGSAARAGALALLLGLAVLSARQARMYRDAETLYTTTLARNPACWLAELNLGLLIEAQGRADEAIARYEAALKLKPDSAIAHLNLGIALARRGQLEQGMTELHAALRLRPGYGKAHQNLGAALLLQGRRDEALLHFSSAVRFSPDATTRRAYGIALLETGHTAQAAEQFTAALQQVPDNPELRGLLQRAWEQAGTAR